MSEFVFGSYRQSELDRQYDQRTLVPDITPYLEAWKSGADRVASALPGLRTFSYGPGEQETLDAFLPDAPVRAVHVTYHGGAWRTLDSRDAWFLAPVWLARGCAFVSVNFDLVPEVSLGTQVEQARRALSWVAGSRERLTGDPDIELSVSGHSSGAHLAAMAGLAKWGGPQPEVGSVTLASGLYDLEPVRLSSRNAYLKLSKEEAHLLSPVRHLKEVTPPCRILWSSAELDEFQRQSSELYSALDGHGPVERFVIDERTHFDTWNYVTPDLCANDLRPDMGM